MSWFRRRPSAKPPAPARWDLSDPLVAWSREEAWSLGEAVQGTLILGATGSGKSSGSGAALAHAMLSAGFGGLVLTVKSDERAEWERACRGAGRQDDLVVFGPSSAERFNFLDEELNRADAGAGLTENIVHLLSTVLEVLERGSGSGGGGREDEGFWRRSNRQLMRNAVDLLSLATGRISVPDLYRLVISAPTSLEQVRSSDWHVDSFCFQALQEADRKARTPRQEADFQLVSAYWCLEFAGLSDKTRSVIVSTFTSLVDVLNRGLLRDLFSSGTTVTPAAAESGKILLIDLPVKEFGEVGLAAQTIWKYAFQRHIERRDVTKSPRPVFLWADEAQHFVTSHDAMFQTTCRSARVATVLLTQSVSNFHAALGGGDKGKAETAALFGNLNTKIFHANSDPVTNEWASTLIGRTLQSFMNSGTSRSQDGWPSLFRGESGIQTSAGLSEAYEFEIQPATFSELRTGGPENGGIVEAILFRSGKRFAQSGRPWMPVSFVQRGVADRNRHAS